ncbi:septum formation protein Maf [bacterium]|nr:septum formation protein Maf [bacterium]
MQCPSGPPSAAGGRRPGPSQPGPRLILASRSPRRAELLRRMGFIFDVMEPDIEENVPERGDPRTLVSALSAGKAEAVLNAVRDGWIVGADTVVVLDGAILEKPASPGHAAEMLSRLSGRTHEVFTGFTLIQALSGRRCSDTERTAVTFRSLDKWEIDDYVSSGAPMDKAGAYGIQDRSGLFVDRIEGCFYNVVGFPLTRFYEALKREAPPDVLRKLMSGRDRGRKDPAA